MSPSCPLRISYFGPTSKSSLFCNMINRPLTRPTVAQKVDSTIHWITQLVFVILIHSIAINPVDSSNQDGWILAQYQKQGTEKRCHLLQAFVSSWFSFTKQSFNSAATEVLFQCLVDINDCNQVGTMCLVAIYYLRSNTCSWDQMSVKYKNALKTRPQLFKHWITVSTR